MEKTVNLIEMTWPEVEQAIQEKCLLVFSMGAVEQHGSHLPPGVDIYLPIEIAALSSETGDE